MPGVLKKSQDDFRPLKPGKRGLAEDMAEPPYKKLKTEALTNGGQMVNGDSGFPNGAQSNGVSSGPPAVEEKPVTALEGLFDVRLPPEIRQWNSNFVSVSALITRLAQETFSQTVEVVNDMSELKAPLSNGLQGSSQVQMNGSSSASVENDNVKKKQLLLDFSHERRTQFIKMLVLLQWSRRSEEVGKAIDIFIWMKEQCGHFLGSVGWLKVMRTELEKIQLPGPDLKTALEALSLGKASWLTDLNYLPLEKLPPRELLKALRRINALLSIRLNLHESIPPPFRHFKIASGRVTFQVEHEFEVDLAIADEDPKSQFYFLDFRFLFSPATSGLPQGRLRYEFETKLNDILGRDGLNGCYRFLHDFVLTHKMSILRHQGYEMVKGCWSDQLKIENIHRCLVVQYWLQRPGSKSWIEIGIRRGAGKQSNGLDPSYPIPEIALRWFRAGKEMKDVKIDLGLNELSLSGLLRRVIAMHTTYVLQETAAKLRTGALYSERLLKLKQSYSATEPTDISLLVQLTRSKAVKVVQEPITGQFAVLPGGPLNSGAERELNGLTSPAQDASARIATLRCITAREEIEVCARSSGWETVRSVHLDRETMQKFFPQDILRIAFFRRPFWTSDWILAITTSLVGDDAWVVQTEERKSVEQSAKTNVATGLTIKLASKVTSSELRPAVFEPTISNLRRVESTAVGMIALHLDAQHLLRKGIPYKLHSNGSTLEARPSSVLMKLPIHRASITPKSPAATATAWRSDVILVEFGGFDCAISACKHVVKARMKKAIPNIKALTSTLSSSITFHPSTNELAFKLNTPVGTSTISGLIRRLATIERLLGFLTIIKQRKLTCTIHSLTRLSFIYATNPDMKATINFPTEEPMQINFDHSSPLLRIQDAFVEILRSPVGGLGEVLAHIETTLPLSRGLLSIEVSWASISDRVHILPRSAECFILRYSNPHGKVEINLNDRRGNIMWVLNERGAQKDESRNEDLEKGLKELARGKGDGWRGLNGGIVATPKAAEELVVKIDELFRSARTLVKIPNQSADTTTQKTEGPQQPPAPNSRKRKAENMSEDPVVLD